MILGYIYETNKPSYYALLLAKDEQSHVLSTLLSDKPHEFGGVYTQVEDTSGKIWYLITYADFNTHEYNPLAAIARVSEETCKDIAGTPDMTRRIIALMRTHATIRPN